jgi:hypothetical protein
MCRVQQWACGTSTRVAPHAGLRHRKAPLLLAEMFHRVGAEFRSDLGVGGQSFKEDKLDGSRASCIADGNQ